MFAERVKHYPNRYRLTSLATAVANITKPVTKNNFEPSTLFVVHERTKKPCLSFSLSSQRCGTFIILHLSVAKTTVAQPGNGRSTGLGYNAAPRLCEFRSGFGVYTNLGNTFLQRHV